MSVLAFFVPTSFPIAPRNCSIRNSVHGKYSICFMCRRFLFWRQCCRMFLQKTQNRTRLQFCCHEFLLWSNLLFQEQFGCTDARQQRSVTLGHVQGYGYTCQEHAKHLFEPTSSKHSKMQCSSNSTESGMPLTRLTVEERGAAGPSER